MTLIYPSLKLTKEIP